MLPYGALMSKSFDSMLSKPIPSPSWQALSFMSV